MITLFDVSGVRARIFHLPNRPPFMIAPDLAEVYGTEPKYITRAVGRNPERFPSDFCFSLEVKEIDQKWFQNGTTSQGFRADLQAIAFTHAGALMLSAVLKTPTAAEVSVIVHRAFAAMEQAALADARNMVGRLQVDAQRKKPIYGYIAMSMQAGLSVEQMWRGASYPMWKLEQAAREMLAMRLIDRLPAEMQPGLIDEADIPTVRGGRA